MTGDGNAFLPKLLQEMNALTAEVRNYVAKGSVSSDRVNGYGSVQGARRETARELLAQRKLRSRYLPPVLFHEPAWDILLCSYLASFEPREQSVKQLVGLIEAPATTSQRWIEQLVTMGLLDRQTDPKDRRRFIITQSATGIEVMNRYLDAIRG